MGVQVLAGEDCPVRTSSVKQIAFGPLSLLNHQKEVKFRKVTQYHLKYLQLLFHFLTNRSHIIKSYGCRIWTTYVVDIAMPAYNAINRFE